jgi:hypothetical protein
MSRLDAGARMEPFTYASDAKGVIYYAISAESAEGYIAASVYYPDASGNLTHLDTGNPYTKAVFHGYDSERGSILEKVPQCSAERVLGLTQEGNALYPQSLFLPSFDISTVYNPHTALDVVLAPEDRRVDSRIVDAVGVAVDVFISAGIPREMLGLYGGLQCGMVKSVNAANGKPFKDVDMLVRGTQYTNNIRELAAEYTAPPLNHIANPIRRAESQRRREITQFTVPGFSSVHCDVRVLRAENDPNNSQDKILAEPTPTTLNGARIVDADQSLCLPFAYQVETEDGRQLWVSGSHYHCLGVAAVNDRVRIQGLRVGEGSIVLSDPDTDYMVNLR